MESEAITGPIAPTEADAEKKWDARNMNVTQQKTSLEKLPQ